MLNKHVTIGAAAINQKLYRHACEIAHTDACRSQHAAFPTHAHPHTWFWKHFTEYTKRTRAVVRSDMNVADLSDVQHPGQ